MTALHWVMVGLAGLLLVEGAAGEETRYVSSREVLLTFASSDAAPIDAVELWVSSDGGKSWRAQPAERVGAGSMRYAAAADGRFGFYVVLKNGAGSSAEPPESGSAPHLRVVVDTTAPTFQLHAVTTAPAEPAGQLMLRATLIDENLGPLGTRVFYRTANAAHWTDGGVAAVSDGQICWQTPPDLAGPVDLRVVATDLAGNRAVEELDGVQVEPPAPAVASASALPGAPQVTVAPAQPVRVDPVSPVTLGDESPTRLPRLAPGAQNLAHLRRLGLRFMGERRYALAAARLEDALKLSPDDADLLVDLGSALYWSRRYDDARTRFEAAVGVVPKHTGAIEGLALVAATQKQYPQAREHLLHLLTLMPGSANTWLRYGDIEHKLGNPDRALDAWERVLTLKEDDQAARGKARKRLRHFRPPPRPLHAEQPKHGKAK